MAVRGPAFEACVKILMIGDSGTGKTCLLLRYAEGTFRPTFITTIGIDFKIKTIEAEGIGRLKVQIWDTAGQERFRTITQSYFRGAQGVIVVYDVTDRSSFESARDWKRQLETHAHPDVNVILLGNKSDSDSHRQVSAEEGAALAKELGLSFFAEVSAKNGGAVGAIFDDLAAAIFERVDSATGRGETVLALGPALERGDWPAIDALVTAGGAAPAAEGAGRASWCGPLRRRNRGGRVAPTGAPLGPLAARAWPPALLRSWAKLALSERDGARARAMARDPAKAVPALEAVVKIARPAAAAALAAAITRADAVDAAHLAVAGAYDGSAAIGDAFAAAATDGARADVCERLIALEPRLLAVLPYDELPPRRYRAWLAAAVAKLEPLEPPRMRYALSTFAPPSDALAGAPVARVAAALEALLTKRRDWDAHERSFADAVVAELRGYYERVRTAAADRKPSIRALFEAQRGAHRDVYLDTLRQIRLEPSYPALVERAAALAAAVAARDHRQPGEATTAADAVRRAAPLAPAFDVFAREVARRTGAEYVAAPRKALLRVVEKIALDAAHPWDARRVVDVLRCSLVCGSFAIMVAVLRLVGDCDAALKDATRSTGGLETRVDVVRLKPRFAEPLSSGYADILINLSISGGDGYVGEIQLAHAQLFRARREMGGHEEYAKYRAAKDLHDVVFGEGAADALAVEPATLGEEPPVGPAPAPPLEAPAPGPPPAVGAAAPRGADVAALVAEEVARQLPPLVAAEVARQLAARAAPPGG